MIMRYTSHKHPPTRSAGVKYPVSSSNRHKGKVLELDPAREVITLLGIDGTPLGNLSWEFVIDQILAYRKPTPPKDARADPRISLSVPVEYHTPEGDQYEGRAGGIGGGGLFIESEDPLPVGTRLTIRFTLPTRPLDWLEAKGIVSWVCPRADQYTFSPGMGIRFTEISSDTRDRVLELVRSAKGTKQVA
jgi:uncharacterized protein (TIGR02266 family)